MADIAIIIGSGFESLTGNSAARDFDTSFGKPSAPVHETSLEGCSVLTLARHGDRHTIPPHAINYRANLAAIKEAGARSIIALNTVGVVTNIREPGEIGVPDQLIDYTWGREQTIFDGSGGVVEHIDLTQPFTAALRKLLLEAARAAGIDCHDGGVYAATQGPRLETAAEVDRLERDGADYIGMTAMPEAALARELGLEYASIAMIVNRAAGRGDRPIHDDVESSTLSARTLTMDLLRRFCKDRAAR
ncbi:MAG: S-methyl-5'-thioinosine phosphorylase [Gammaproteobacteria bacterium]|nr:S-methyl-5'-thioinosine phosphorylase [Gammaproteobacteria bacterium]